MKMRLGFAVAAQMEPDVLLIDEVLAVGDVGFRAKCFNAMGGIAKNAAVVFVSHAMPQVARTASEILLLNKGKSVRITSYNVCYTKLLRKKKYYPIAIHFYWSIEY